jgi:hypothetical protein
MEGIVKALKENWLTVLAVLLTILVIIWVSRRRKSKFSSPVDSELKVLFRSGLSDEAVFQKSQPYLKWFNEISSIGFSSAYERDESLGETIQFLYMGGTESLFGSTPSRTVIGFMPKNGEPNFDVLRTYTNPDYTEFVMSAADAQRPFQFDNKLPYIQDKSLPSDVAVLRLVRGGHYPPIAPGEPWTDVFPVLPLEVHRGPRDERTFMANQAYESFLSKVKAARNPKPSPAFLNLTYSIECPPGMENVANALASVLKRIVEGDRSSNAKKQATVTVTTSSTPSINIMVTSLETNLSNHPLKQIQMPLQLLTVPTRNMVHVDIIAVAAVNSYAVYENASRELMRAEVPSDRSGPVVLRLEGDVDPSLVRSRIDLLNRFGNLEPNMPLIVRYTKKKNSNRPVGAIFGYLESYDTKRLESVLGPEMTAKVTGEFPPGSFVVQISAHHLVNGVPNSSEQDQRLRDASEKNPLLVTQDVAAKLIQPIFSFLEGKGEKPLEENIVRDLGCPTPDPCPSCPLPPAPEPCPSCPSCPSCPTHEPCPSCPVPEPCPSCPLWDPSKAVPSANVVLVYTNSGMTNGKMITRTLAELIRTRLAFANKTVKFTFFSSNSGPNMVNKTSVRIRFGTAYNKTFVYPTDEAGLRSLVDTVVSDLTPQLL